MNSQKPNSVEKAGNKSHNHCYKSGDSSSAALFVFLITACFFNLTSFTLTCAITFIAIGAATALASAAASISTFTTISSISTTIAATFWAD